MQFHQSEDKNLCTSYIKLYNLYKDSYSVIGCNAFTILTKASVSKHPIATCLIWQECKNYFSLHSAFIFKLECLCFQYNLQTFALRMNLTKKSSDKTLLGTNAVGAVDASVIFSA